MKRQGKLNILLAAMLTIQTITMTGCVDNSDSTNNITTEITTESITQIEIIQTELQETKDNEEDNTQIELPNIIQTINEDEYKPFDIRFDEFIDKYNYFSKHFTEQAMEGYEQMPIEDENIDFYSYDQTENYNVYVIHIGGEVEGVDIVVYCSPDDVKEILNIEVFTNPIYKDSGVDIDLYGKIGARTIFSIICSIARNVDYNNMNKKPDLLNDFYEELELWSTLLSEEDGTRIDEVIKSYRSYTYSIRNNLENANIEFNVVKE